MIFFHQTIRLLIISGGVFYATSNYHWWLITGVVAAIELVRYLSSEEDKQTVRIVLNLFFILVISGLILNFAYFAPKRAGDDFVDGFSTQNSALMLSSICEGTELYSSMQQASLFANFNSIFGAGFAVDSAIFIPILNRMEVTLETIWKDIQVRV
jgi:hypothetical protein